MQIQVTKEQEEFHMILKDLINSYQVQKMEDIIHHVDGVSCLDHSLFVAFLTYKMSKFFNMDFVAATRGALLHDLHLQDWSTTDIKKPERLVIHPAIALENASKHYELGEIEKDIIITHMWPITIKAVPRKKESVIVNLADKICAVYEYTGAYKKSKTKKRLNNFNKRYGILFDTDVIAAD